MPDFNELYRKHNKQMEDFWSRRPNAPKHERTIHVFGYPVVFDSNHLKILDSADYSERMYSSAPANAEPAWHIHIIVHDSDPNPAPPPERLVDLGHYAGAGDWLSIEFASWGNCFVDMARGEAYAVIASTLAEHPEQASLVFVNTILTNLITRRGYSMLHASALVKEGDVLLLMAPHGTGKSTTALHLLLNGYKLISDSMVYIGERDNQLWMGGFPVGRIKLRADMLPRFPGLAASARPEPVRDETKHRVDLDVVDPSMSCNKMIQVGNVDLCLLERSDEIKSQIESLTPEELWPEIMVNSLHYDTPELWQENLERLDLLLNHANLHRLKIGTSEDEIVKTINQLWNRK